jgi:predicted dithiol-disulfide oxidoreductase (DUF899 family)
MTAEMKQTVVSRDEWLRQRKELLAGEKALTRQRDELSRRRRELPWVRVGKEYRFAGPDGERKLADLFDGRSQLIVYHFMFAPEWEEGCPGCSFLADHFDGARIHLEQRDTTLVAVSRARLAKIEAFRKRMGWSFPWVSAVGGDFNRDFGVWFPKSELAAGAKPYNYGTADFPSEDAPGASVFTRDETGQVFHTYSTYGRGLEAAIGMYQLVDLTPKGRDEDGLPMPMAWLRHHDRYGAQPHVGCCAGEHR